MGYSNPDEFAYPVAPELGEQPERMAMRKEVLQEAEEAVLRGRNKSYGEPDEDFQRIAALWTALGVRINDEEMRGHHVSMLMTCLKLSRLTWNPTHKDSWVDQIGYGACGYETAMLEAEREKLARLQEEEARRAEQLYSEAEADLVDPIGQLRAQQRHYGMGPHEH